MAKVFSIVIKHVQHPKIKQQKIRMFLSYKTHFYHEGKNANFLPFFKNLSLEKKRNKFIFWHFSKNGKENKQKRKIKKKQINCSFSLRMMFLSLIYQRRFVFFSTSDFNLFNLIQTKSLWLYFMNDLYFKTIKFIRDFFKTIS